MTRDTKSQLLKAGIELLGENSYKSLSVRSVEEAAKVPHGSIRHHFGNFKGYVCALTESLVEADIPDQTEDLQEVFHDWLIRRKLMTKARYELSILGLNNPDIGDLIIRGRNQFVERIKEAGVPSERARLVVAALDGIVFDGLLRGDSGADIQPILSLINDSLTEQKMLKYQPNSS